MRLMEISIAIVLGFFLSAVVLAVVLFALYWVVRLAVRHGMNDSRAAEAPAPVPSPDARRL